MNSTAENNFADWYRSADSQLTASIQTSRIAAINILLEIDKEDFWLDVVRLHASVPVENTENLDVFLKAFKDEDPIFPLSGNDYLVKILS